MPSSSGPDTGGLLVDSGAEDSVYGIAELVDAGLWQAMVPDRPVGIVVGTDGSVDADAFTTAVNALLATNADGS